MNFAFDEVLRADTASVEPTPFHADDLGNAVAGQHQGSDCGEASRIFLVPLRDFHCFAKGSDFGGTKPTSARFAGDLANARCGIVLDDVIPKRVGQEALQRRDSASGNARPTGSLATAPTFLRGPGRLSSDDVHLHLFDVGDAQGADLPSADQRYDMRLDPAAIHGQRRSLDRPVLATEDRPGFGVLKIPIADFSDRDGCPGLRSLLGRIGTADDRRQLQDRLLARLLDGEDAIATDHDPAAAPFLVPVLNDEGLET